VLFSEKPRPERGVLLVPVPPGTVLRSVELADTREREPASQRTLPVAAALAGGLAVIAGAVLLFARGSATKHAPSAPAPVLAVSAPKPIAARRVAAPLTPPRVSALKRVKAAAVKLAARLPVALESSALLRSGSTLYLLGGTTRAGAPTDGIWQVDLRTGQVTSAGTFIEPLTGAATAARAGELYLAGGWTGEKLATGVLRWSPGRSSALVTRLPAGLRGAYAAFVGSTLYVVSADGDQAYAVDVDSGTVSAITKVPRALAERRSNLAVLAAALGSTSGG
jgi:hypothetical protein